MPSSNDAGAEAAELGAAGAERETTLSGVGMLTDYRLSVEREA
jgi:hypothetical protein